MRTIHEQIANRCIHFNGIMNDTCKAGISYADVRIDKPYKFPCLNHCDTCELRQFPDADNVASRVNDIEANSQKAIDVYLLIQYSKEDKGIVACSCGGKVSFAKAHNNHVRAKCDSCDFSMIE